MLNLEYENQSLLSCVKFNGNHQIDTTELRRLFNQPLNWQEVFMSASRHGILPLLSNVIEEVDSKVVPYSVKRMIRNSCLTQISHSICLDLELRKILEAFEEVKLPVMVLKGPVFAEKIYSDKNLRVYTDIDLLVNFDNFYLARDILAQMNYMPEPELPNCLSRSSGLEWTFRKSNSLRNLVIELHWMMIDPSLEISIDDFENNVWQNAKLDELVGTKALLMKPEDMLIYACLHLSVQHNFSKLVWFRDLFELTRQFPALDWDYIITIVQKLKISTQIYYSLYFAQRIVNCDIPDKVLKVLRPKNFSVAFFEATFDPEKDIVEFNQAGAWLFLRDRSYDRYKMMLKRLFSLPSWFVRYQERFTKLKALRYLIYPILIVARWFEIVSKIFRRIHSSGN